MTPMNRLQRYHPFSRAELITPFDSLINDFFNDNFAGLSKSLGGDFFVKGSYPKVNVLDLEDKILIEAAVPGMNKEDISIELKDNVLTLTGQSSQDTERKDAQYVRRELKKSKFQRSFALGKDLVTENIVASYENGILTLELPKVVPDTKNAESRVIDIV